MDRERKRPLLWGAMWFMVSAVIAAPFLAGAGVIPTLESICFFKETTGVGCPGCGLTRSLYTLAGGQVGESLRLHAFGILAGLGVVGLWLFYTFALLRGREPFPLAFRGHLTCVIVLWILFIAYWGIRLATGALP